MTSRNQELCGCGLLGMRDIRERIEKRAPGWNPPITIDEDVTALIRTLSLKQRSGVR
jgi:hypothetical protein